MKFVLIAALSLFCVSAFTATKEKKMEMKMDKMSFEDAKKMHLEMHEKKMAMMESERKCTAEAKEKKDLRECMRESMENEREMKNTMREEMKADLKDIQEKVKEKI